MQLDQLLTKKIKKDHSLHSCKDTEYISDHQTKHEKPFRNNWESQK